VRVLEKSLLPNIELISGEPEISIQMLQSNFLNKINFSRLSLWNSFKSVPTNP
jgi:hypothetical protein